MTIVALIFAGAVTAAGMALAKGFIIDHAERRFGVRIRTTGRDT